MVRTHSIPQCFGDRGTTTVCRSTLDPIEMAATARALAHPARLAILGRFGDRRPKLTKELVAPSGLAPSTMSEHLRILREAGVLVARNDGPGIWYCLCPDRLAAFEDSIHELFSSEAEVSPTEDQRP